MVGLIRCSPPDGHPAGLYLDRIHDVDQCGPVSPIPCSRLTKWIVYSLNATITDLAARKQTYKKNSPSAGSVRLASDSIDSVRKALPAAFVCGHRDCGVLRCVAHVAEPVPKLNYSHLLHFLFESPRRGLCARHMEDPLVAA
jgi:hypothetical protein